MFKCKAVISGENPQNKVKVRDFQLIKSIMKAPQQRITKLPSVMNWKLGNQRSNGHTISITGNKLKGLLIRIIFNCMAKVVWDCFLLALLWSMIGQENTHHTLNKLNA